MLVLAFLVAVHGAAPAATFALDCDATHSAGYRVLALEDGRKVAVWYPAAAPARPFEYSRINYGFKGLVASDAPPLAGCPPVPILLFSHEVGGCALQSIFITEELARHGYVVAAPDHRDAGCPVGSDETKPLRTDQWYVSTDTWTAHSNVDRLQDLRDTWRLVAENAAFAPIVDVSNVGAMGHSLGGYVAIGMAGGWALWKTPEIRAVLALSPYVAPFIANGSLKELGVPVMLQIADSSQEQLEGQTRAYELLSPPKYLVELDRAKHLEWTNFICLGQPNVATCLIKKPNAAVIDRYAIAFLDRYLKGKAGKALDAEGVELTRYLKVP
jgi:predicted dienelactone hydrolase